MRARPSLLAAAFLLATSPVVAEEQPTKGTITLPPVTIVGRIQRPIVTIDVNRVGPKFSLGEPKQSFVDPITQAAHADPF